MLVTIVGATDQRKKMVGVGQPLDMEVLKVKGLFRQREPSLWITEERGKKNRAQVHCLFYGHMYCKFCFVLLYLGAVF